ncbi:MAG TPA: hypothetical protein VEW94_14355 [Chloroflexia bacterium]|nr:hypothetical protein [Chloroflexia bacterium]
MVPTSKTYARWRDLLNRVPPTPLIAFLLVSLPLTAIAIYYLPYPDSTPGIFGCLVVQSVGFFLVLAQQKSKSIGMEQYLTVVLTFASGMALFSTFYAGRALFVHSSSPTLRTVIANLVISFICLAVFALLRGRTNAALHRLLSNPFVIGVQFIILLTIPFFVIYLVPDKWAEAEERARHGPAAPWQVQLSVAQAEAARRDSEAVLEGVTASQVYARNQDHTTTLNTRFYFVTPSGERFKVVCNDIDPQGTASIEGIDNMDQTPNGNRKPTREQLQMLRSAVSTINLSPREALQRTVFVVLSIAGQHGKTSTDPWIELHIDGWVTEHRPDNEHNLPALWRVEHTIVAGVEQRHFWLDPATGEIVERTTVDP